MSWAALETAGPELAREGWARFERTRVALLGTIRVDGSPRISPVEPFLLAGELVFAVMASPKLDDLRGDGRCAIHSSVSDSSGTQGEFKVYGRAVPTSEPSIVEAPDTWWHGRPRDRFEVFAVEIAEAVLVAWSTDLSRMRTFRWTPDSGVVQRERQYP
jgi:hypothetical protein